tara:strand:+ start:790 stop:2418 length:1629 start_codon:yes stop_codon:yes gene_type:complete
MSLIVNSIRNYKDRQAAAEKRDIDLQAAGYTYRDGKLTPIEGTEADFSARYTAEKIAALENRQKNQEQQNIRRNTNKQLIDYSHTGDPSHLNIMLDDPATNELWKNQFGIEQFASLDAFNDKNLLEQFGIPSTAYETPEQQNALNQRFVKTHDGEQWQIQDMRKMAVELGVMSRVSVQEGEQIEKNFNALTLLFNTKYANKNTPNQTGNIVADNIREDDKLKLAQAALQEKEENNAFVNSKNPQTVIKNTWREKSAAALVNAYGGADEEYYSRDMSLRENQVIGASHLSDYISLGGKVPSEAESKVVREVVTKNPLLQSASELGNMTTGKIDNALIKLKDYINIDSLGLTESQARSAFLMMTSMTRSEMYGSAQSPEEMANFTEAYGSLGETAFSVLSKLQIMVRTEKAKVKGAYLAIDPRIAHLMSRGLIPQLDRYDRGIGQRLHAMDVNELNNAPKKKISQARMASYAALNKEFSPQNPPSSQDWDEEFNKQSEMLGVSRYVTLTKNPYKSNKPTSSKGDANMSPLDKALAHLKGRQGSN